jgi:hypothetical protein
VSSPAAPSHVEYCNFDVRSEEYKVFSVHDFNMKEHGFELANRFYPGVAPLLDRELDTIFSMTYNTCAGAQGYDTAPFRHSIWFFVNRLYGMYNEAFDHRQISVFLRPAVKEYVKRVACFPHHTTRRHHNTLRPGPSKRFRPDEKAHIVLLACEAHRQASLLYGLHAVMQHMTH